MLLDTLQKSGYFDKHINTDMKVCHVPDIYGFETLKILFIPESPHKDEVSYGVPLAGRSGRDMTLVLLERLFDRKGIRKPPAFGRCMQIQSAFFKHFGVMNVCNLPLQPEALNTVAPEMKEKYADLFAAFKTIRSNPGAKRRSTEEAKAVDEAILNDFSRRLSQWIDKDVLIIPCGAFARAFIEKAALPVPPERYLGAVPHPSYGQWLDAKHRDVMNEMIDRIKSKI